MVENILSYKNLSDFCFLSCLLESDWMWNILIAESWQRGKAYALDLTNTLLPPKKPNQTKPNLTKTKKLVSNMEAIKCSAFISVR